MPSPETVCLFMMITLFSIGILFFVAGAVVMIIAVFSQPQKAILEQTQRLAQKGLAEDVAGLVGNAAQLLSAMNDVATSRSGVGLLLMVLGLLVAIGAFLLMPCACGA